jgi:vacuolar protein sorting-associated protein IST1
LPTPLTGKFESKKVVRKVSPKMPSRELVDAYLAEIAKAYGVKWGVAAIESEIPDNQGGDTDADKGVQVNRSHI